VVSVSAVVSAMCRTASRKQTGKVNVKGRGKRTVPSGNFAEIKPSKRRRGKQ